MTKLAGEDVIIDIDLSQYKDIDSMLKNIERKVRHAVRIGLQNASQKIVSKLRHNMHMYGVQSLDDNIVEEVTDTSVNIRVVAIDENGNNYANYIEFGTGIIGKIEKENPHPSPKIGWEYDVNDHGEVGWIYLSNRDGKFHWTAGSKAKPFTYETAVWARKYGIIRREINKELAKLKP